MLIDKPIFTPLKVALIIGISIMLSLAIFFSLSKGSEATSSLAVKICVDGYAFVFVRNGAGTDIEQIFEESKYMIAKPPQPMRCK